MTRTQKCRAFESRRQKMHAIVKDLIERHVVAEKQSNGYRFRTGPWRVDLSVGGPAFAERVVSRRPEAVVYDVRVPKDWLERVHAQGIAVVEGRLVLEAARVVPPPSPSCEAWGVHVAVSDGVQFRYCVRYADVTRLHFTPEAAFAACVQEYTRRLGLEDA